MSETPNADQPILAPYFRLCVLGKSNTGKTETSTNLIVSFYLNHYHRLVILAPNYKTDKFMISFIKKCKKLGKTMDLYDEYTPEVFESIIEQVASEEGKYRTLLIIDDPIGQPGMMQKTSEKSAFNAFVTGIKHNKCSMFFITQLYGSCSLALRHNFDGIIMLKNTPQKQLKSVAEDYGQVSPKEFKWLYTHCTRVLGSRFFFLKVQGVLYEMYHGSIGRKGKIFQITDDEAEKIIKHYRTGGSAFAKKRKKGTSDSIFSSKFSTID